MNIYIYRHQNAKPETIDLMERTLEAMEETHAQHQASYVAAKAEMRTWALRIQALAS
jgi:hypothetical protein